MLSHDVLRRELEETRQRAGDAEERAARAEMELAALRHEIGEVWFAGEASATEALRRKTTKLEELRCRFASERDEARGVVAALVNALFMDDEPRRRAIEEASGFLEWWGMR